LRLEGLPFAFGIRSQLACAYALSSVLTSGDACRHGASSFSSAGDGYGPARISERADLVRWAQLSRSADADAATSILQAVGYIVKSFSLLGTGGIEAEDGLLGKGLWWRLGSGVGR
jgi:hypothetical protein